MKSSKSILVTCLLAAVILRPLVASGQQLVTPVTLAWSPSPDSSVIGYNLYFGEVSGSQTNKLSVGPAVTATVSNLQAGVTCFFFATAYDASGIESEPSNLITYTPTAPGQADLVITALSYSPAAPFAGNLVRFSAVVRNQGSASVPAGTSLRVGFSVDSAQAVTWCNFTNSLAAGSNVTITADGGITGAGTWTASTGVHPITATVDALNALAEVNETNNQYQVQMTVAPTDPNLDTDGDGMTNVAELLAGTDPNDANSNLRILSLLSDVQGNLTLRWASVPGIIYRVMFKSSPSAGDWSLISPAIASAGNTTSWTLTSTNAIGIYGISLKPAAGP